MTVIGSLCISLGGSTVQLYDRLDSRCACHVQRLVSVVKMVTVLEVYTSEEHRSLVRFLWGNGLSAKDIHKEMFSVYGGKCLSRRAFQTGARNSLKDVRRSQMLPDQLRKWLRQQSKNFHAASFDAVVKRWDKCINVDGGYFET
jgi:isochorismate hydrolase